MEKSNQDDTVCINIPQSQAPMIQEGVPSEQGNSALPQGDEEVPAAHCHTLQATRATCYVVHVIEPQKGPRAGGRVFRAARRD